MHSVASRIAKEPQRPYGMKKSPSCALSSFDREVLAGDSANNPICGKQRFLGSDFRDCLGKSGTRQHSNLRLGVKYPYNAQIPVWKPHRAPQAPFRILLPSFEGNQINRSISGFIGEGTHH